MFFSSLVRNSLTDKLIDIFQTGFGFIGIFLFQFLTVASLFQNLFDQFFQLQICHLQTHLMDQCHKGLYFQKCFSKGWNIFRIFQCLEETDTKCLRMVLYLIKRYISNTAFGDIDNPAHCQIVFSIINGLQISQNIFNLFSGIEINTANQFVWHIGIKKFFLKKTGLGIGTVQNCKILILCFPASYFLPDLPGNIFRLIITILKLLKIYRLAFFIFCPECFFFSSSVVGNHCIGRIQNMLRRTVILLQFDYFRIGKYMFKIQNILNICSAELVDGLIIITYHAQIVIFAGQNADQLKLYCIGILILIYHNVAEPFLIVFQYIRTALKQFHCLHQQIIKIQCIVLLQFLLVFQISICHFLLTKISLCLKFEFIWGNIFVFRAGNDTQYRTLFVKFRIQFQPSADVFHDGLLIFCIINRKIRVISQPVNMSPQNADACRMECAHPHALGTVSHDTIHTFPHLTCRLIRKGNGKNIPWIYSTIFYQMSNSVCQNPGFS